MINKKLIAIREVSSKGITPPSNVEYSIRAQITVSSLSLGRGTTKISLSRPMSLEEIAIHLVKYPNDRLMAIYLDDLVEEKGEEVLRECVRLFKLYPSTGLFKVFVNVNSEKYPFVLEALNGLDRKKGLEMFTTHPDFYVRRIVYGGTYKKLFDLLKAALHKNRIQHVPITKESFPGIPVSPDLFEKMKKPIKHIKTLVQGLSPEQSHNTGTSLRTRDPEETLDRIEPVMVQILGSNVVKFRRYHNTFIVPYKWNQTLRVVSGRHNHAIHGDFSSSGKGVSQIIAAVSGAMEMIERYSAYEGTGDNWPEGYKSDLSPRQARLSELKAEGLNTADPNQFNLPYPYEDQPLFWVKGEVVTEKGIEVIYVPAQTVFENSNLDEPSIFYSSSNGLASGNSMEEAKLHALLEIIERDGDFTMIYSPEKCSVLTSTNPIISPILEEFNKKGLSVQILDLTTEFGVPTYRAFVKVGSLVLSGSGTHLDGRIALLRAVCELAPKVMVFEFDIYGRPLPKEQLEKQPLPEKEMDFDSLPNYSTGNVEEDLKLIESLMTINGFPVIYANLTRSDFQIPVVRAMIPGLDMPYSVSARQLKHLVLHLNDPDAPWSTYEIRE